MGDRLDDELKKREENPDDYDKPWRLGNGAIFPITQNVTPMANDFRRVLDVLAKFGLEERFKIMDEISPEVFTELYGSTNMIRVEPGSELDKSFQRDSA